MPLGWLDIAQYITSTASNLSTLGFGAAKATTRLGFSIARGVASITPIPFLTTSLNHLENVSLLPILLGETITSTSLVAASAAISYLLQHTETEASFSLTSFVELVRREWAEFGVAGRSVIEVSRAIAAWAAIQGFTKQWSEERWLKAVVELTPDDLKPPPRPRGQRQEPLPLPGRIRRAISKVSVTEDIIAPGRQSQVISADIGERVMSGGEFSPSLWEAPGARGSNQRRLSNYETWKTMRRLSKVVLAGYGGPTLLFFGVSLYPDVKDPKLSKSEREQTDKEVKDAEEDVLVHAVKVAEADALSPRSWSDPLPDDEDDDDDNVEELPENNNNQHRRDCSFINQAERPSGSTKAAYSYSWWNVLLGKHDRDIFEGFAFAEGEDSEPDMTRSAYNTGPSSPTYSHFGPSRSNSFKDGFPGNSLQFPTMTASVAEKLSEQKSKSSKQPESLKTLTAVIGDLSHMPRFWVLTDHGRRQVIVVVRGTMSFNEIAADLACDPASFTPATMSTAAASEPAQNVCEPPTEDAESQSHRRKRSRSSYFSDSGFAENRTSLDLKTLMTDSTWQKQSGTPILNPDWPDMAWTATSGSPAHDAVIVKDREQEGPPYEVHGGMLRLARAMGSKGKPVYEAVLAALSKNRRYELVLCGHSLGAGLATLFALMWADPVTCRTVPSSGLPPNRRVSVYAFAPPCVISAPLSLLCKNMVTSFVYSYDAISRLSLGSMRDMNRAAYWLCEGTGEASTINLLRRALQGKFRLGGSKLDTEEEKKWFIAVRKTLEASMHYADMFPPGRVWWVLRNESLHPSHQIEGGKEGLRVFEVIRVEDVFRQIEFKGDMLSSHIPSQYIRIISELQQ